MVITRVNNGPPDMIMMAFDVKFRKKKDGMPPGACRPLKRLKKNNVDKVDPQKLQKKQYRQSGLIYAHIPSYTFIYLQIPPNSFIYLYIAPHTLKY